MAALDFTEIASAQSGPDRDRFELFAREFFDSEGFRIIEQPDRGADGEEGRGNRFFAVAGERGQSAFFPLTALKNGSVCTRISNPGQWPGCPGTPIAAQPISIAWLESPTRRFTCESCLAAADMMSTFWH